MIDIPLSIKKLQKDLLDKKYSAVELVDYYLGRIDRYNTEYNVFLTIDSEGAYKKAKAVDKIIEKDNVDLTNNPLLGIPVSIKDLYSTKGIRTTAGAKVLESYVPDFDATVVKKIKSAGGIMLGKVNCDAWAHGGSGENSDFGSTKNPWNREYVPGGSSSGSAASVSGGMSLFSMGTDTGGSTRQPASFCNLVGLKPTYGAISRYGTIAMASSLDTMGIMTHTVEDCELIFDVLRGEDGFDSTVKNFKKEKTKTKMKIGIAKEFFTQGLSREVENMISEVKKVYQKIGIDVVEVSLPHTKYMVPLYYIIQPAEVSSNLGRYDGIRFGNDRNFFSAEAKRRIMLGSYVLSSGYYDEYYLKAQKVRTKLIQDFDSVFEKVDAILSPVSTDTAFKLGENIKDPLSMYVQDIYTTAANLAGIPGLAVPYTFSQKGLPLGFQLLGPKFSEHNLFSLASKFHNEVSYVPKIALP